MSSKLKVRDADYAANARDRHLFVLNLYKGSNGKRADILGTFIDSSNKAQPFKIVSSWVPQDLSNFAPKDLFLEKSSDFLSFLRYKWIVIVDTAEAKTLFEKDPKARKELEEINLGTINSDIDIVEDHIDLDTLRLKHKKPTLEVNDDDENLAVGVSPSIVDIMERPEEGEGSLTSDEKLNQLMNLIELTEEDVRYIQAKTKDPEIVAWLSQQK